MKHCTASIFLLALLTTFLSAQINSPSAGFIRYDSLPVERLYGVPGNLVPAESNFGAADAISFSDLGGLVAANGRIELVRGDGSSIAVHDYGTVTPLLNIDRGLTSAVAWLPDSSSLVWWNGKSFARLQLDAILAGQKVSSVALTASNTARVLATNADATVSAIAVSLVNGNVLSSDLLPGVTGPAFQFGSTLIWADERGLQLESENGNRHSLVAPARFFNAERMSSHWVHLYFPGGGTHWALHLGDTEPTLWRLPAAVAATAKGNRQ